MFNDFISSMPCIEKRKKSLLFRISFSCLGLKPENDFSWILYSIYRDTFFVSVGFALLVLFRLYFHFGALTENIVINELRIFTFGMSVPILLILVPYYYSKARKVVGFSKIDFMEIFPRRIPRQNLTAKK